MIKKYCYKSKSWNIRIKLQEKTLEFELNKEDQSNQFNNFEQTKIALEQKLEKRTQNLK